MFTFVLLCPRAFTIAMTLKERKVEDLLSLPFNSLHEASHCSRYLYLNLSISSLACIAKDLDLSIEKIDSVNPNCLIHITEPTTYCSNKMITNNKGIEVQCAWSSLLCSFSIKGTLKNYAPVIWDFNGKRNRVDTFFFLYFKRAKSRMICKQIIKPQVIWEPWILVFTKSESTLYPQIILIRSGFTNRFEQEYVTTICS